MAENDASTEVDPEREGDDAYGLSARAVARIMQAVDTGDRALLLRESEPLHAADIADLLEQVNASDRHRLIALFGKDFDGDVLAELDESIREDVLATLSPDVLATAVRDLESDDVVDLVEDLERDQQDAILDALEDSDRAAVEQSLTYPEYSAGRLMQREVVMAPEHWSVGDAIDYLRNHDDLPEQFYHIILVDPRLHPVGNVTLGRIMAARRDTPLKDLVEETFHLFKVTDDEADVAYAFNQYHLISAPVVDEDERLVGMITIDDAMTVLDEEHEEDILRLGGVGEGSIADPVLGTSKRRIVWLVVNLGTAVLASVVISQFEETIAKLVALAVLMPIVASMGGNAGTQSLTVAVRALATKDLTRSNTWRFILREGAVGLINGLALAIPLGLATGALFASAPLGAVIAAALIINIFAAALSGTLVPIVLDKLGIDPALGSGVLVTTVTDVVGFFAFLGLAALVLQ